MPRPYPERSRLMGVVIERVRAGETLEAACGQGGVPPVWTVQAWARADAGFRGLLDAALRVGKHLRLYAYDPAVAAAFVSRVARGERIVDVVGQPGMPGWATYRYWRIHQQPFQEAMGPMRVRRDQGLGARGRARLLQPWDPALGDRVLAAMWKGVRASELKRVDAALPSAPTLRRWRREQPGFDAAVRGLMAQWKAKRRREAWCAELSDVIWEKIVDGGSLGGIAREPGMPSRRTLSHWVKTQPRFAARVASACVDREYWYRDNVDDIEAEMARGMSVAELKAIQLRSSPFRQQLGRLKNRPGRRTPKVRDIR